MRSRWPRDRASMLTLFRCLAIRLAAALLIFGTTGCGVMDLPGIGDVAIDGETSADDGPRGPALKKMLGQRLASSRVEAEIEVDERKAHLVVQGSAAPAVRQLLLWRGGVVLHALLDTPEQRAAWASEPGVQTTRDFTDADEPTQTRVRKGSAQPLLELPVLTSVAITPDGKGLELEIPDDKRSALAKLAAGNRPLLAARGETYALGRVTGIDGHSLRVSVGEGLYAYTRADRLRQQLATATLPPLTLTEPRPLASDYFALAAGLFLPLVLSLAWLAFVRRFDRMHPEPRWLVTLVFALGALSVIPAGLAEYAWTRVATVMTPTFATMGGRPSALPLSIAVFTIVVGISEEGSKLLAALVVRRRREFDEPVDGIVYGVAASLGFAAAENVKYFALARLAPTLVLGRTFTSIPGHLFFGALWGYALGQTLLPGRPKTIVLRYFLLAALLHGAFDALLSTKGFALFAFVLNLAMASVFVVLIRRVLRRPALNRDVAPPSVERRTLVTVGSPAVFWLAAVGLHAGALLAVILGAMHESTPTRASAAFFVAAGLAFTVLVLSAWALSATLPLDVVVDAVGVTFAGSLRRWESVRAVEPVKNGMMDYLRVSSDEGALFIGPVPKATLEELRTLLAGRAGVA